MENLVIPFLVLLVLVAFFYASVGHGGASGYLALMAFFEFSPSEMRPSALLLNIFVSGIAFFQFYRSGHFRWKLFYPFVILSVPLAFAGANVNLDTRAYRIFLGICLAIAALRLAGILGKEKSEEYRQVQFWPAVLTGGAIGFVSGVIGIGGGILLSPVIVFLRWGNMKETACVSALFILVNSMAGFSGVVYNGAEYAPQIFLWVILAITGGFLGSYFGNRIKNQGVLKYLLSAVLFFACVKLIIF